jgi:hypothetical protein
MTAENPADRQLLPDWETYSPQVQSQLLVAKTLVMRRLKHLRSLWPLGMALFCLSAFAQTPLSSSRVSGSAEGQLTVTLTVVSSTGIVIGPDGEQHVFIANAADPADNVSRLESVRMVTLTPVSDQSPNVKPQKTGKKSKH